MPGYRRMRADGTLLLRLSVLLLWNRAIADGSRISTSGAGSEGSGAVAFIRTARPSFFYLGVGQPSPCTISTRPLARTHIARPHTVGMPMLSPVDFMDTAAAAATAWPSILLGDEGAAGSVGYSKFSYYTTLGLYVLSFPGLWSVVKRATKTKYKEATYELPGPASSDKNAESVKQTAAKIIAYFQANNYKILEAGEEITFEGAVQANKGQAFFLVFCTALCFATLALVLQIQFPAIGNYWFLLTLASPYAGVYYWQNASRNDKAKVRLETSDDDSLTELYITGAEEELDRLSKTMGYMEKGKIRVKGILEGETMPPPVVAPEVAAAAPEGMGVEGAAAQAPTPQETEA